MQTNNTGIITSTISRHWTWGLIVLLLAALALAIVAGTGTSAAEAASTDAAAVSGGDETVETFACGPLKGDVNNDCVVTMADVQTVLSHMGQSGSPCDLDGNGAVWLPDLYIVLRAFGQSST